MKIRINPFLPDADPAALWQHYSGQQEPQPVFASLDLRDGEYTIDYNGEIGNAVPEPVWNGEVLRFPLDVIPTAEGANRLLERTAPTAQRLLDTYQAANQTPLQSPSDEYLDTVQANLEQELAYIPDGDRIDVWHIDTLDVSYWDDLTADMTDEQVTEYATELLADLAANSGAGLAVCDGLVDSLLEERDSRRAAETV